MAYQQVPKTAAAHVYFRLNDSDELVNTYYFRDTVVLRTQGYFDDLAQAVADAATDATEGYQTYLTEEYTVDRVEVKDLDEEFGKYSQVVLEEPGVQTTEPAPPNCAILVNLRGDGGGAPNKGWLFLPPGRESVLDGATAQWDPALLDSAEVIVGNIRDAGPVANGTTAMVIVSRIQGGALRTPAVTNTLSAITARALIGNQRDRRPGVGS